MFFILHFDKQIKLQTNHTFTEKLFFFSSRFQSERESGDRNFAIGYYLKEKKVFKFCLFQIILLIKYMKMYAKKSTVAFKQLSITV